jgi:acetyltransferase-like isoleucine patch superfamily enzyme
MLPFNIAIKIPIIVSRYTKFRNLAGDIFINTQHVFTGMITLGFSGDKEFLPRNSYNLLDLKGKIIFHGKANLGCGITLAIKKGAVLIIGDDFTSNFNARIICKSKIEIGNNVRFGWDVQVVDTNFHFIRKMLDDSIGPHTLPIRIGNRCWVGSRTTLMPGVKINPNTIIASNSLCNRDYTDLQEFSLIGGIPAKLIRTNLDWISDLKIEKTLNKIHDSDNSKIDV